MYDLFELIRVPSKNHGVTLVKGDDPYSPAYKILNPDLIPPVPESAFRDLVDSIQAERGFLLLLNLKQFKRTRGSLLTVEKLDGSGPVFEVVSNGKANTLDVVLSTENKQQVVSIEEADLATGHWRNITLFVQEERVQLYAGCEEVSTAEMDAPIQSVLTHDTLAGARLRVGKGAVNDRFMVRARTGDSVLSLKKVDFVFIFRATTLTQVSKCAKTRVILPKVSFQVVLSVTGFGFEL